MSKEKIVAAYELLADRYNDLIDHKPHNAYYDRPNTLKLLPDVAGTEILDAACGPGKYAEILMGMGAKVTGFDISPKMVAHARKRTSGPGHFFVHDLAYPLDMFEDRSFDHIICALAMHYLEDWTATVREFHRVLKPNGSLVISMEHPFFQYLYFKSNAYFDVESVHATWSGFGKPTEVYSYRRSLHDCITPLTETGFLIDRLIEPKPVAEFEKKDPRYFKELNEFPSFMHIRALKQL